MAKEIHIGVILRVVFSFCLARAWVTTLAGKIEPPV